MMTPALKAMVEAMSAEMRRQVLALGEDVDVERIARAGLEAISEPSTEQVIAGQDALDDCVDSDYDSGSDGNGYPYTTISASAPAATYRAMIDAILKEPPP
jgi:hypothetical protein